MTHSDYAEMILALVASGESYYVEFKSTWEYSAEGKQSRPLRDIQRDIQEAICAFANSDGGDLLVGVEDSGALTGVPFEGDKLAYLLQAPRHVRGLEYASPAREDASSTPLAVPVRVMESMVEGTRILLFRVEASSSLVVTSSGRCLWRRGPTSEPVPPDDIRRRRAHRLGDSTFESQPVPSATVQDLHIPWRRLRHPHLARFRSARDPVALLRYWNLLEGRNGQSVLRRAALLLFARDPLHWHANNRLRIRRSLEREEGIGRNLGTREIVVPGPIWVVLREAPRILLDGLEVERKQAALFGVAQLLPTEAVQECIVNAVVHRNYAIEGGAIEVVLYPDRLEFRSPGTLPEPLTVEDLRALRGVHRSRNPLIMRVLRDLGYTRDQGEGMRRIFDAMSQVELHAPDLEERADAFIVRLSTRSNYDDQTRAWLAAYVPSGLEPSDRKLVVAMKRNGQLSVDRLARALGQSYDATKRQLVALERRGIVWHAKGTRTYRLVEPLDVPMERALTHFQRIGIAVADQQILSPEILLRLLPATDQRSLRTLIDRLREAGIIIPAPKQQWRFGPAITDYARRRQAKLF